MAYILSSQGVRIEQAAASFAARLAAFLIDFFIVLLAYFLFFEMVSAQMFQFLEDHLVFLVSILPLFYPLLCEIFWNGQTIGKRCLKIRVISLDGGGPKITSFILRWLMLPFDIIFAMGIGELCIFFTKKQQRLGDLIAGTWVVKTEEFKRTAIWGEI